MAAVTPGGAQRLAFSDSFAEELEGRAVKLIGARLGDDVDDAGRIAAVLGGVVVGDDAEFLDRFRIRRGIAGAAQARRVVAAIELEVDACRSAPSAIR